MGEMILLFGLGASTAIGAISGAVADIDDRGGAALRGGATGLGLAVGYLVVATAYRRLSAPAVRQTTILRSDPPVRVFRTEDENVTVKVLPYRSFPARA